MSVVGLGDFLSRLLFRGERSEAQSLLESSKVGKKHWGTSSGYGTHWSPCGLVRLDYDHRSRGGRSPDLSNDYPILLKFSRSAVIFPDQSSRGSQAPHPVRTLPRTKRVNRASVVAQEVLAHVAANRHFLAPIWVTLIGASPARKASNNWTSEGCPRIM